MDRRTRPEVVDRHRAVAYSLSSKVAGGVLLLLTLFLLDDPASDGTCS